MIKRPITAEEPRVSVIIGTIPENSHEQVVNALYKQSVNDFEVIVVDDGSIGICEARNNGVEAATGEIIAFTDDDCVPPLTWIESIITEFDAHPEVVCIEGPVRGGMAYSGYRKYPACNLAVSREAVQHLGGFREDYEYWREDTELGWRLEEYGETMYSNEVEMIHPPQSRSLIKSENEQRLREEYPKKYNEIIIPNTLVERVNDWLWRKKVWAFVDQFRY